MVRQSRNVVGSGTAAGGSRPPTKSPSSRVPPKFRVSEMRSHLRLPAPTGGPRHLNVVAGARVRIDSGRVSLADPSLRLGRLVLPDEPLRWLSPVLSGLVQAERRLRPVLASVQSLAVGSGRVALVYSRMDLPPGLLVKFMADRAGSTFAVLATRDAAAARALEERLAGGFRVDDFFPEAADLPEDIQDAELQARYGGVGGPLFQKYAAEVEQRFWSCRGYRVLAPPGSGARPS